MFLKFINWSVMPCGVLLLFFWHDPSIHPNDVAAQLQINPPNQSRDAACCVRIYRMVNAQLPQRVIGRVIGCVVGSDAACCVPTWGNNYLWKYWLLIAPFYRSKYTITGR